MPTYLGADGATLHYDLIRDHGEPIITLAGGAARHPDYLGDLAGLGADRHHLIVPHLRGVGRSPAPDDAEIGSYWRQAEDIDRLRAHLGLDRAIIAGHSAGTRLAIAYAARFPDRLAAAILITPPSTYLVDTPSDSDALIAERRGDPDVEAALTAFAAGPAITADTDAEQVLNDWAADAVGPISYHRWDDVTKAHSRVGRVDFRANRAFFSVDPPDDLAARLTAVTAPVLVVAGANDYSTGLAPVLALAALFPAGRAETIAACGHFPWVEQPADFRRVTDAFLATL